jgi:cytochrome c oxidase cbb3-type subunit 3
MAAVGALIASSFVAAGGVVPERAQTQPDDLASVPVVTLYPNAVVPKTDIANPYANDPASAERGMKYFSQFNCIGCHAPNGAGGMGPSLSMGDFKYGGAAANIFLTIYQGRPAGMPAWGETLPKEVIWDLVSYILSISKHPNTEWGHTVSLDTMKTEQVPAESLQSTEPWSHTQPFGFGQKPNTEIPPELKTTQPTPLGPSQ